MKYVVITDYPYNTLKDFFETKEEAEVFNHPTTLNGYPILSSRMYELVSFKVETTMIQDIPVENKKYLVNLDSEIKKV